MYLVFTRMPGERYLNVPLVEFMYLVFTRMPGESYPNLPLVEFMYLVFTRMLGESYPRRLRSVLLCLCDVFRALINSLVCCFLTEKLEIHLTRLAEHEPVWP